MPRIALVANSKDVTGAFKAILNLGVDLGEYYDFVYIIPKKSKIAEQLQLYNFKYYELPFLEIRKSFMVIALYLPMLFSNTFRLRRILKKERIHLIHSNDYYNLCSPLSTTGTNIKSITHVRFMPSSKPRLLSALWLSIHTRLSEAIICVSKAVKRQIHSPKAQMIYDKPRIETYIDEESDNDSAPWVSIAYVANYTKGKGHEYALYAFSNAANHSKAVLHFAGSTMSLKKNERYKKDLIKLAEKLGIIDRVRFHGFIKNIHTFIRNADIALNFSESESFSYTCFEALAAGTALIATDCGGPAELFEDRKSGWLVSVGDLKQMTEALQVLIDDQALRQRLGEQGKLYVEKKFNYENTMGKMRILYQKLLRN